MAIDLFAPARGITASLGYVDTLDQMAIAHERASVDKLSDFIAARIAGAATGGLRRRGAADRRS